MGRSRLDSKGIAVAAGGAAAMTAVAIMVFVAAVSVNKFALFPAVVLLALSPALGAYLALRLQGQPGPVRTGAVTALLSPFLMVFTPWALWPLLIVVAALAAAGARLATPGSLVRPSAPTK